MARTGSRTGTDTVFVATGGQKVLEYSELAIGDSPTEPPPVALLPYRPHSMVMSGNRLVVGVTDHEVNKGVCALPVPGNPMDAPDLAPTSIADHIGSQLFHVPGAPEQVVWADKIGRVGALTTAEIGTDPSVTPTDLGAMPDAFPPSFAAGRWPWGEARIDAYWVSRDTSRKGWVMRAFAGEFDGAVAVADASQGEAVSLALDDKRLWWVAVDRDNHKVFLRWVAR